MLGNHFGSYDFTLEYTMPNWKLAAYPQHYFEDIDLMMVIFGSPGLVKLYDTYEVLHKKMEECKKPIFPVLPSIVTRCV